MDTEGLAPGFMASEMDPQKTVRFCINKSMLVVDHSDKVFHGISMFFECGSLPHIFIYVQWLNSHFWCLNPRSLAVTSSFFIELQCSMAGCSSPEVCQKHLQHLCVLRLYGV